MNRDLPVGLAFAYLKGSIWALEQRPKESRLQFQLREAKASFNRAITKDRGFVSRKLEKIARECGWV